jgi:hypothetical protein
VELSGVMARITKEKLDGAGDVIQADAEHLPSTADAFDDVARFEALFARNVTKLPLLLYWRSKDDRILKGLHGKIPSLMGTVGMVVGSKESHLSASVNAPRRSETTSSTLFPS